MASTRSMLTANIATQIYKFEPSLCFLRGKVNSFIRESTNLQSLGVSPSRLPSQYLRIRSGDDWWLAADGITTIYSGYMHIYSRCSGGLAYRVDILEAEHEISVLSLKLSCISRKLFSVPEYVNSASATAGRAAAQLDDMAKAIQKSMVTAHGVVCILSSIAQGLFLNV